MNYYNWNLLRKLEGMSEVFPLWWPWPLCWPWPLQPHICIVSACPWSPWVCVGIGVTPFSLNCGWVCVKLTTSNCECSQCIELLNLYVVEPTGWPCGHMGAGSWILGSWLCVGSADCACLKCLWLSILHGWILRTPSVVWSLRESICAQGMPNLWENDEV